MIRAMMLSNIVASCAVELSDCVFFAEAGSRWGAQRHNAFAVRQYDQRN
jgi:hypothetical protein